MDHSLLPFQLCGSDGRCGLHQACLRDDALEVEVAKDDNQDGHDGVDSSGYGSGYGSEHNSGKGRTIHTSTSYYKDCNTYSNSSHTTSSEDSPTMNSRKDLR